MNGFYEKLLDFKHKNKPMIVVTAVQKEGEGPVAVGKKMLVTIDGQAFGTVGGGAIEHYARDKCKQLLKKKDNLLEKYALTEGEIVPEAKQMPMACGGIVTLFYEYVGPMESIVIFGAGHVAQALVNVLDTMNFHVIVVDPRPEVIDSFRKADEKHHMGFVDFIGEHGIDDGDYVVVSTPSHKHDYHVVNKILKEKIKPAYLGMLCSEQKLADYLKKTYESFGENINLDFFYSPVGLDIGGISPEEIAVSISAEILMLHHGKKEPRHMRESIHDSLRYWSD